MTRAAAVLGAGSWGTALAVHLGRLGHSTTLWARGGALGRVLAVDRVNAEYLPGIRLPSPVSVTSAIDQAVRDAELVLIAVPSHGVRAVIRDVARHLAPGAIVVSATKGLETDTMLRMSQVIAQEAAGHAVVVLSGPSFAIEVARELPTAVVAASSDRAAVHLTLNELRGSALRLYGSDDVIGVEICGAMKNVIAIAAGVVDGLGLGHNARAALITRGLAEIKRLACAAGGQPETTAGLSGLGDLVLTCTGAHSRNRRVGLELASGRSLPDILAGMTMIAEGVKTTGVALALGARYGVELPIVSQMSEVFLGRATPHQAVESLMLRRQRAESDGR